MNIIFKGNPVTVNGNFPSVGDEAKDFTLINETLNKVTLKDTKGKRVFVTLPSVDTKICDLEIRRFNQEASKLKDVTIYVVSMDLPFAQSRWCGAANANNVVMLSDFKDKSFGENYGVYMEEIGLLARTIIIVDEDNKVSYTQYCSETSTEPNYEEVLEQLR